MDATVAAAEKSKMPTNVMETFATVITTFSRSASAEELLQRIPAVLVSNFHALRAELWLWDETSGAGYLTYAVGRAGTHRLDFIRYGTGALGKVAEARTAIENIPLASFGGDDAEFAKTTELTHIAAYPLIGPAKKLLGLIAVYTQVAAAEPVTACWATYAEMCGIKVPDLLTSREQQKRITQLSLLFEATRLLNSTLDLAELLELILKIARQETKADRGSVFLVDNKQKELWSIVAQGLNKQEIRVPWGRGIAGRIAQSGEVINVEDAYTLEYFDRSFDQKFAYRTKSLLGLPIRHANGEIVGVIQLLNKSTSTRFDKEDEDFLLKLSGHMALALENARLHRESLEKQRMEKELALARDIQRSLLPDSPPVVPGFELAVGYEPCFEVGGDYYDFVSLGPQSLLFVVADVEGKGVSSALVMSNLQATLRALVMHLHSLEVLALSLNEMIFNDTRNKKYLSAFLALVDTRRGGLHYINAGHVPPILIHGASGEYKLLEEGGTVIGLFPKAEYKRGSVMLENGDVLVACTDGILEAWDEKDDEYGTERLAEVVAKNREKSAQGIVEAVLEDVNNWCKGHATDDKVFMVMKVSCTGELEGASSLPEPRLT